MTDTTVTPEPVRWHTGTAELAYTDSGGSGTPVLLIHGGGFADWFTPLAATPALHHHRVIRQVRAGYTGAPAPGGSTVADHAGHAAALLRHLRVGPTHVVAHSSGSPVALQLAVDHPELVGSLSLVEPPLIDALAAPEDRDLLRAALGPVIGASIAAAARGDLATAFDTFMTAVCGAGYRRAMTDALGAGAVERAEAGCRSFFTDEVPALNAWTFDDADLATVRVPVLLIQGDASPPPVHRLVSHLAGLLPDATVATLPDADHLMPLTRPTELADLVCTVSSRT